MKSQESANEKYTQSRSEEMGEDVQHGENPIPNVQPETANASEDLQQMPASVRWFARGRQLLIYYLDLKRDKITNSEAIEAIISGIDFKGSTLWVLICAVFVASLGLNMNSIPVIIGAMLISPLMGPIMGMGLALGVNDGELLRRCSKNLLVATIFALLTSCLYFLISPINDARSELLARTQPTIYDVLIAFFGGFAGIIATGSRSKGNVIPGVAIATALMPPLCTSGYGLATLQWNFFFGAFYLFLINCVYIGLATWVGVRILKLPKHVTLSPQRQKLMARWVPVGLLLVMVPSIVTTYRIVKRNIVENSVQMFINKEFSSLPNTQVLNYNYVESDTLPMIEVSLIGKALPQEQITNISTRLPLYHLDDMRLKVMQGAATTFDETQLSSTIMQGVVKVTMDQLEAQMSLTDSLRSIIYSYQDRDNEAEELKPVLQALFPKVSYIAISHAFISSVSNSSEASPVTMVIVYVSEPLSADEQDKIYRWLVARKETVSLQLVVKDEQDLLDMLQKKG